jgi:hypothetical protein
VRSGRPNGEQPPARQANLARRQPAGYAPRQLFGRKGLTGDYPERLRVLARLRNTSRR